MKKIYEYMESFSIAIIFITVLILFMCRIIVVDGDSMNNTLNSGEKLLITNFMYTPEKGDIVVTDSSVYARGPLIKRVIATGGDTILIDYSTGDVYVNSYLLEEDYIAEKIEIEKREELKITLPEGYLFLMGDNRNHSADSRIEEIGLVNEKNILGKAIFRISPLSEIGKVK